MSLRSEEFAISPAPATPSDPYIGQEVGALRLVETIGVGGFGSVYRATHRTLGTSFAVKLMHIRHQNQPALVARFEREARTMAGLSHPHIIRVSDFGQMLDGSYFLVMDFLNGEPLEQALEQGYIFSLREFRMLVGQLFETLAYVHSKGMVHRDLKPANIFLEREPGREDVFIKLLDFGIVGMAEGSSLTRPGTVLGSPPYMAPEQIDGKSGHVDNRTDLYAAGVILCELLAGKRPFEGDLYALLYKHISETPPPLSVLCPHIPWAPELEAFLQKALSKSQEDRFSDAAVFLKALQAAIDAQERLVPSLVCPARHMEPISAAEPTPPPTSRLPSKNTGTQAYGQFAMEPPVAPVAPTPAPLEPTKAILATPEPFTPVPTTPLPPASLPSPGPQLPETRLLPDVNGPIPTGVSAGNASPQPAISSASRPVQPIYEEEPIAPPSSRGGLILAIFAVLAVFVGVGVYGWRMGWLEAGENADLKDRIAKAAGRATTALPDAQPRLPTPKPPVRPHRPAVVMATITFTSSPKVEVWQGGNFLGTVPFRLQGSIGSSYQVELRAKGYETRVLKGFFSEKNKHIEEFLQRIRPIRRTVRKVRTRLRRRTRPRPRPRKRSNPTPPPRKRDLYDELGKVY